jgi:hypothetical protein
VGSSGRAARLGSGSGSRLRNGHWPAREPRGTGRRALWDHGCEREPRSPCSHSAVVSGSVLAQRIWSLSLLWLYTSCVKVSSCPTTSLSGHRPLRHFCRRRLLRKRALRGKLGTCRVAFRTLCSARGTSRRQRRSHHAAQYRLLESRCTCHRPFPCCTMHDATTGQAAGPVGDVGRRVGSAVPPAFDDGIDDRGSDSVARHCTERRDSEECITQRKNECAGISGREARAVDSGTHAIEKPFDGETGGGCEEHWWCERYSSLPRQCSAQWLVRQLDQSRLNGASREKARGKGEGRRGVGAWPCRTCSIMTMSVLTPADGMGDAPIESSADVTATRSWRAPSNGTPDTCAIHNTVIGRSSALPSMLS